VCWTVTLSRQLIVNLVALGLVVRNDLSQLLFGTDLILTLPLQVVAAPLFKQTVVGPGGTQDLAGDVVLDDHRIVEDRRGYRRCRQRGSYTQLHNPSLSLPINAGRRLLGVRFRATSL